MRCETACSRTQPYAKYRIHELTWEGCTVAGTCPICRRPVQGDGSTPANTQAGPGDNEGNLPHGGAGEWADGAPGGGGEGAGEGQGQAMLGAGSSVGRAVVGQAVDDVDGGRGVRWGWMPPLLHPLLDRLAFWDMGDREEGWEGEYDPGEEGMGDVVEGDEDDDYADMYAPAVVSDEMVQQVASLCVCVPHL